MSRNKVRAIRSFIFPTNINEEEEEDQDYCEPKKQKQMEKREYVKWLQVSEKAYVPAKKQKSFSKIPAGAYNIYHSRELGLYVEAKTLILDELFILPSKEQDLILSDIKLFWTKKEAFAKYKFIYKRGILLYGAPGAGKSSAIFLLAQEIIKNHDGVVFFLKNIDDLENFASFIKKLRDIEPDKQILCVLEDLETFTHGSDAESFLLNLLDGGTQLENIVYLATTNYPENLKDRILNRPSRFDRRYEMKLPNNEVREAYFKLKLTTEDMESIDLKEWVKETKGLSLAHLGEIIKSVFALGNTFEHTMKLLKEMKEKLSSHDFNKEDKRNIGFYNGDD